MKYQSLQYLLLDFYIFKSLHVIQAAFCCSLSEAGTASEQPQGVCVELEEGTMPVRQETSCLLVPASSCDVAQGSYLHSVSLSKC